MRYNANFLAWRKDRWKNETAAQIDSVRAEMMEQMKREDARPQDADASGVSDVKAQLTEAHWDTQKASKVYPGQILEKDPVVKNIGENSANVFLEVNVPMRSIAVLDGSTGRKTIRENRELFTFQADETKWTLLYQEKTSGNKKYIYGYKSVLNPGESTTPLFRKLAAVSYLEGELDASVSYDVPVIASVIQEQDGSKTMKEIYQEYLKQADIDQKEARG